MEIFNTCLFVAFLIVGVVLLYVFIIAYDVNKPIYEILETQDLVSGKQKFGIYNIKYNQMVTWFDTIEQANEYFNENCTL